MLQLARIDADFLAEFTMDGIFRWAWCDQESGGGGWQLAVVNAAQDYVQGSTVPLFRGEVAHMLRDDVTVDIAVSEDPYASRRTREGLVAVGASGLPNPVAAHDEVRLSVLGYIGYDRVFGDRDARIRCRPQGAAVPAATDTNVTLVLY